MVLSALFDGVFDGGLWGVGVDEPFDCVEEVELDVGHLFVVMYRMVRCVR